MSPETLLPGASDLAKLQGRGHSMVVGKTGSGKSKFLQRHFTDSPFVAFYVNPHREPLRAQRVESPRQFAKGLQAGARRFHWHPPRADAVQGGQDEVKRRLAEFVTAWMALGKRMMKGDKAEPWLFVIVDEAQLFTQKTGGLGPVESLLSEGRKFGIRCMLASQRPARVSLEALGQVEVVYAFEVGERDAQYLDAEGFAYDEFRGHVQKPYHFAAAKSNRQWVAYNPIPL